ncbi:hypothetical protein GCM10007304_22400 [Rhodococcoides trifolii]|uniref:Methyltransferase domain-containing protein n=1 Tax=Rhodococcoides trifolii TaxID=908250 RepID=A0A917D320_9NOCA|nr:class I SAM-dependent methyltransferase [Rhodococcus trifolii]GGG07873.1 hypothetical protein GCM10007304_22400 [Rhodococcus trifolii]
MTHSFDKKYWDDIWQSTRGTAMADGAPNPYLMHEVAELTPGTALEAGCGAGTEAIWLAQQGWRVTGADIAADALAHASARASGLDIEWVEADLSTWRPDGTFDLVTTHYAHPAMPQLEFYDRLATWVAPAGTLLIVGHLHHGHHGDHEPPESASATAAGITALLDPAEWEIVTARETSRQAHEAELHDVVVRARRR